MTRIELQSVEATKRLADHLTASPLLAEVVRRRGAGSISEEAWEIATGLADIQGSASRLFDELVPSLLRCDPNAPEFSEILHDIGEEYRHIAYHISATKYFGYVTQVDPP
jgi:hypothetical protein